MSCFQAEQLTFAKVGVRPLPSFHSVNQSCQHAVCPDPRFGPRPVIPDGGRSGLHSQRHCRRCVFLGSSHSTSTFLPPFAQRELPRFNARMRALTSAAPSSQTNALTSLRISMLTLSGLLTIPSPTTVRPGSCHQLHTTPTVTGFHKAAPWQTDQVKSYRHHFAVWVSPLASARPEMRLGLDISVNSENSLLED